MSPEAISQAICQNLSDTLSTTSKFPPLSKYLSIKILFDDSEKLGSGKPDGSSGIFLYLGTNLSAKVLYFISCPFVLRIPFVCFPPAPPAERGELTLGMLTTCETDFCFLIIVSLILF